MMGKSNDYIRRLVAFGSALLLTLASIGGAQSDTKFESPPTLRARDLAPASLLNGSGFHVEDNVPTDGLTANYTIHTDLGTLQAHGLEMLEIRVAEVPAMMELQNTSKTKVFARSLATNAVRPVTAAGQMILNPVDTVKGLPGGVSRFFGRVGHGAQKIKEAATEPAEASAGEKTAEVAKRTGLATRDVFGYEQERRELAKRMHVDPYTTNPILSRQLDDFALTAFRAHVGVTTTMAIFVPGSMAITATRIVSTWVWDTPRADLIVMNRKKLEDLLVSPQNIKAFMNNRAFPLSVQTAFVESLTHLRDVPGVLGVVALANTAESEDQARFLTDAVDFLAKYHQTQTPLVRLIAQRTIVGRDRAGTLVVPAEADYVVWTARVAFFANRPDLAASKRSIWLSGRMSPLAKKNFESLDWTINENSRLMSAPSIDLPS
jgi:hypothetical protein